MSGVRFRVSGNRDNQSLYYLTNSWNSEPQNIEQEISNDEVRNRCAQSVKNQK
ncbi:hypothetical protein D1AOALGA4SA_12575 [Olavius algarvensis Delta 1 endosymbiont]|nr:hypothetical protein D1AOALGA4SA_12575 [Olavius algarvensis Delta 1 endosymbiont]